MSLILFVYFVKVLFFFIYINEHKLSKELVGCYNLLIIVTHLASAKSSKFHKLLKQDYKILNVNHQYKINYHLQSTIKIMIYKLFFKSQRFYTTIKHRIHYSN